MCEGCWQANSSSSRGSFLNDSHLAPVQEALLTQSPLICGAYRARNVLQVCTDAEYKPTAVIWLCALIRTHDEQLLSSFAHTATHTAADLHKLSVELVKRVFAGNP
jgi:hypothetical protein